MSEPIHAFVFDAYGTLFDPLSLRRRADEFFPGRGAELSQLWRAKQLEYSWLRTLMQRYRDFGGITRDALAFACQALQLSCTEQQRDELVDGYLRLETFPDVTPALQRLSGRRLAILSNGSPQMLNAVIEFNGLAPLFQFVLSVDALRLFKPHPSVPACRRPPLPPQRVDRFCVFELLGHRGRSFVRISDLLVEPRPTPRRCIGRYANPNPSVSRRFAASSIGVSMTRGCHKRTRLGV